MTAPAYPEIELVLTSTAMAGDAGGLYRIVGSLMDQGVPFDAVLFDYLMPTERSVGRRWAQGDYLVAEEHAVTAAIETVVSLMTGMLDQPEDAPLVVIATAEGDDHSLPARAVAAHLLFEGYRTTFLGANVPAEDLRDFMRIEPPLALVLSAAMSTHLHGAYSVIKAAHEIGVPVLVGGMAFGGDARRAEALGADGWAPGLRDVAAVVRDWSSNPPEMGVAPELPADLSELIADRVSVVSQAEQALGAEPPARLRDEVRLLVSAVEGALLAGDDQIIVDLLQWQSESLLAHKLDPTKVLSAVESALIDTSEAGLAALARASARLPS